MNMALFWPVGVMHICHRKVTQSDLYLIFLVHLSTGKEQKYNRIALLNYRFSDKRIICIVEDVIR